MAVDDSINRSSQVFAVDGVTDMLLHALNFSGEDGDQFSCEESVTRRLHPSQCNGSQMSVSPIQKQDDVETSRFRANGSLSPSHQPYLSERELAETYHPAL